MVATTNIHQNKRARVRRSVARQSLHFLLTEQELSSLSNLLPASSL